MKNSVLVALNESASSRAVLDYLTNFPLFHGQIQITLLHLYRKPTASEEMMGQKYMSQQEGRFQKLLDDAKNALVKQGFAEENIETRLVTTSFPTITDGIIDEYKAGNYEMVIIGRKRMSKAEEFVMGDVGMKLVRALETGAILVVKS